MSLHRLIEDALDRYDRRYQGLLGKLTQSGESAASAEILRLKLHMEPEDAPIYREVHYLLQNRIKEESALRTELETALAAYEVEVQRQSRAQPARVAFKPVASKPVAPKPVAPVARPAVLVAPKPAVVLAPKPAVVALPKSAVVVDARPKAVVVQPVVVPPKPAVVPDPLVPHPYEGIPFRLLQMGAQFGGGQYSKGWWFANLWEEVRVTDFSGLPERAALEAERDLLLALTYTVVFQSNVKPTAQTVGQFNDGMLKPKKNVVEDDLLKVTLLTLFRYGYEEFGITKLAFHRHQRAGGYLKPAASLFKKRVYQPAAGPPPPANDMQDLAPLVAFRGEARTAQKLIDHDGAKRKHLSMAAQLRVDQPWHPFHGAVPLGLYYRRGAQDNCLITVHSIAASFDEATKFPLVSDRQIFDFDFPDGDPRPSTAAIKAAGAAVARVTIAGHDAWLVGTETSVHVLTVAGNVGDTEQHQIDDKVANPFRERATGDIALTQYLAVVRIRRVHYGPSWEDGHTVFVQGVHVIDAAGKNAVALAAAGPAVAATAALTGRANPAETLKQLRAYLTSGVRHVNALRRDRATAIVAWDATP